MRFVHKQVPEIDAGRTVTRFIWWPTTLPAIQGDSRYLNTVWLQRAHIRQRFGTYGWTSVAWAMGGWGQVGDYVDESSPWWRRLFRR